MFSRRELCFWKCARTIQHKQSVSSKLYSAQAGEQCYKRSGSEAQFSDCYTLLGFDFVQIIQLQPITMISSAITTWYDADGNPFSHLPECHTILSSGKVAPNGYYGFIITTRTPKYYMDIIPHGYYDINSTTCSGMGSTPHSWYSGGRGFDLDGGMYKKSAFEFTENLHSLQVRACTVCSAHFSRTHLCHYVWLCLYLYLCLYLCAILYWTGLR